MAIEVFGCSGGDAVLVAAPFLAAPFPPMPEGAENTEECLQGLMINCRVINFRLFSYIGDHRDWVEDNNACGNYGV